MHSLTSVLRAARAAFLTRAASALVEQSHAARWAGIPIYTGHHKAWRHSIAQHITAQGST